MVSKKISLKQKKPKKIVRSGKQGPIIEKKPFTDEERAEKMQKDMLRIAKRYEDMKLYDDAISYYKKLGMGSDVERITNVKEGIYLPKARDFEANGKYELAARLYNSLGFEEDLNRMKRLMGEDVSNDVVGPDSVPTEKVKDSRSVDTKSVVSLDGKSDEPEIQKIPKKEEVMIKAKKELSGESGNKIFKICPYCGEELNLPKKPKFCPYCAEKFV